MLDVFVRACTPDVKVGARGAGIPSYGEGEGAEVYTAEKISFGKFLNQSYRNPTQVDYQKMVRRSS